MASCEDLNVRLAEEKGLEVPKSFGFPFQPYDIQQEFMTTLFKAIDQKKLGIFESPTGTGKSLSLLCGSLTWMQMWEKERMEFLKRFISDCECNLEKEETEAKKAENWILAQFKVLKKKEALGKAKREFKFLVDVREKREKYLSGQVSIEKIQKFSARKPMRDQNELKNVEKSEETLEDLLLNDEFAPENYSDSDLCDSDDEQAEEPEFVQTKIIFASRTHTQLGQFLNELKRTGFSKEVTTAALGSRQNLCINSRVRSLKNLSMMNDRCLELQKASKKGKKTTEAGSKKAKTCSGCEYFQHSAIEELKNEILSQPMDIEELVKCGKSLKGCPYYAARKAAKDVQLLLVPYNSILHEGTREGVKINTKNSVVLLDEAHNIVESISNMHSSSISKSHLLECCDALKTYMKKYMSRFSPKNLLKLKQITHVIKSLIAFMDHLSSNDSQLSLGMQDFKIKVGIDNLDLFDLLRFTKLSKLMFKLKGYLLQQQRILEKSEENVVKKAEDDDGKFQGLNGQSILAFVDFLKCLLTCHSGGRVICDQQQLKFLLLSCSDHFEELVQSARCIILAGGTMKPYEEVENQLFSLHKERIVHFSCDHVIPKENLICMALGKGPSQVALDFTFKSRNSQVLLDELSRTILNVSKIVPGGLVCFLPSYDYENTFYSHLKNSGFLEKIEKRKKVFREPKNCNCDRILSDYGRQIRSNAGGAALLAVIGGKLSEGINFSDDLGRCVVVVGLPYPNVNSVEIQEKVKSHSATFGEGKGSDLLTNLCSKAVNQSIGRAIRHREDYAAILLLDQRYGRQQQQQLLPNWIQKRFSAPDSFGSVFKALSNFFSSKINS